MPYTLLHNVDPLNSCQKFLKKYLKYVFHLQTGKFSDNEQ